MTLLEAPAGSQTASCSLRLQEGSACSLSWRPCWDQGRQGAEGSRWHRSPRAAAGAVGAGGAPCTSAGLAALPGGRGGESATDGNQVQRKQRSPGGGGPCGLFQGVPLGGSSSDTGGAGGVRSSLPPGARRGHPHTPDTFQAQQPGAAGALGLRRRPAKGAARTVSQL